MKSSHDVLDDEKPHLEREMAHLMSILEVAAAIAMTGGLAWVATRKPTPVRVRAVQVYGTRRERR